MKRFLAAVPFLALLMAASAYAAPLYDDLAYGASGGGVATPANGNGISVVGPLYNSFSTLTDPYSFNELKLSLGVESEGDGGSFSVDLFEDDSTAPGTLLAHLGTILDSDLTNNGKYSVVDLKNFGIVPLSGGETRYWIGLTSIAKGSAYWEFGDATYVAGIGVSGEYSSASGKVFQNDPTDTTPQIMQINNISDVPEPLTLSLMGAGLAGAAGLRRRRKAD
jgi:hypothetical protein